MMGKTHSATGLAAWLTGCTTAALLGHPPGVYEIAVGAPLCAFGAIWPDIDCPSSSVAHSLGPPTRVLARIVAWAGRRVHAATRTPLDSIDRDGHRTITHGVLFAVLSFTGFGLLGVCGARWAVMLVTALAAGTALHALGVRGTGRLVLTGGVVAAAWWWPAPSGWWLGWAIGAGALVHSLGDCQTNTGAPLLWPIKIRGQRWFKFKVLRWFRFETGADGNPEGLIRWVCGLASTLAALGMVYAQWPEQVTAVLSAFTTVAR